MKIKIAPAKFKLNPRIIYTALSATVILIGTYLAIRYAQGDFRLTNQGILPETGLLAANSFPNGAQVYINNRLVTATDDTIYLEPGEYEVKIAKDGYSSWTKMMAVKKELVAQTNATLFPSAPSISPLTFTGAENSLPSPDGRKIVFNTASASSQIKNGLYLLELGENFNPFQKSSRQIAIAEPSIDLSKANFIWSPDSSELMVLTKQKQVLISINDNQRLSTLPDVTFKKKQILSEWEEEMYLRERQYLQEFPKEMLVVATQSAKNVYISPDKKRLLYTATASAILPKDIVPPVPSASSQPEERTIEPGSIYVYDREEDKNFKIAQEKGSAELGAKSLLANDLFRNKPLSFESSPSAFAKLQATSSALTSYRFNSYHSSLFINTLQWFSDSKHLLFIQDDNIQIMEYDGTNNTTLYSGPFAQKFIYPWPDGSRIIILTSFSPNSPKNLYAIELK
ncbi:MAG: PEGA domain-containing protein [Patescibacteria group bacterium]|nr:PEGA domain-containing protein [Patescibacteria group bacterium]